MGAEKMASLTIPYTEELIAALIKKSPKSAELLPYLPLLNAGFHLSFALTRESAEIEGTPRRGKIFEIISSLIQQLINRPAPDPVCNLSLLFGQRLFVGELRAYGPTDAWCVRYRTGKHTRHGC